MRRAFSSSRQSAADASVWLLLLLLLDLSCRSAEPGRTDETTALFDQAVASMNAGRFLEAQERLDRLIRNDSRFFKAYPMRWTVLGKLKEADSVKAVIRKDVDLLEKVPPRARSDDLYFALMGACDWLGDAACKDAWREEAIARLPGGRVDRATRIGSAWDEKDPVKSAAQFEAVLRDFPDNAAMKANAARGRFEVMSDHSDQFSTGDLEEAARNLESVVAVCPNPDDNPQEYVRAMLEISKTLAERSPARALECATRGVAFVERVCTTTDAVRLEERYLFWPSMIRAYGAAGDWKAARRVCDALIQTVDEARIPSSVLLRMDEAAARRECGRALERTQSLEESRMQLGLAAAIDPGFQRDVDAYSGRHPLAGAPAKKFETALGLAESRLRGRRDGQVRSDLLAGAESRPAPGFVLKDLDGRSVGLEDFRGRVLLLSFWATWCGPCIGELRELESAYRKYRRNPRISFAGVSIDADKDKVPGYAQAQAITFPILLSDGDIEASYQVDGAPILYVIDAVGKIRFVRDGWLDDGYGSKRIDWMIEAALRQ